jgi:lipoate-protein ligase A
MLCLNPDLTDPFFNLAAEEYLLKNSKKEYLILYVNAPSVIIGKHQVAHREINYEFITEKKIPVIRRISGGGTVFHDYGNLNFTFISNSIRGRQVDFRKYTMPVIEFLALLGVVAGFEGKNDLKVDGYKISGNAEHVYRERVLHHGTLLFDTSLDVLKDSLKKDRSGYLTRAVESNLSSVMNLKNVIKGVKNINDFRLKFLEYILKKPGNEIINLTAEEIAEIASLSRLKFRTWDWNYAYGPDYHFNNRFEINGRNHSCRLFVKDGIIHACSFEGSDEMIGIGKKLIGCRHMAEDMLEIFRKGNILINEREIFKFF